MTAPTSQTTHLLPRDRAPSWSPFLHHGFSFPLLHGPQVPAPKASSITLPLSTPSTPSAFSFLCLFLVLCPLPDPPSPPLCLSKFYLYFMALLLSSKSLGKRAWVWRQIDLGLNSTLGGYEWCKEPERVWNEGTKYSGSISARPSVSASPPCLVYPRSHTSQEQPPAETPYVLPWAYGPKFHSVS